MFLDEPPPTSTLWTTTGNDIGLRLETELTVAIRIATGKHDVTLAHDGLTIGPWGKALRADGGQTVTIGA